MGKCWALRGRKALKAPLLATLVGGETSCHGGWMVIELILHQSGGVDVSDIDADISEKWGSHQTRVLLMGPGLGGQ